MSPGLGPYSYQPVWSGELGTCSEPSASRPVLTTGANSLIAGMRKDTGSCVGVWAVAEVLGGGGIGAGVVEISVEVVGEAICSTDWAEAEVNKPATVELAAASG